MSFIKVEPIPSLSRQGRGGNRREGEFSGFYNLPERMMEMSSQRLIIPARI